MYMCYRPVISYDLAHRTYTVPSWWRQTSLTAHTPYRVRDVTQWTKNKSYQLWRMRIVLQVRPISTLMPLESKWKQNTINNTDWNVSCYCNSKLPKTYTLSGTFILKDGRYTFIFYLKLWRCKEPQTINILSSMACRAVPYSFTFSHKRYDFREEKISWKQNVFSLHLLSETLRQFSKNWRNGWLKYILVFMYSTRCYC
jgi:hypothetical protein